MKLLQHFLQSVHQCRLCEPKCCCSLWNANMQCQESTKYDNDRKNYCRTCHVHVYHFMVPGWQMHALAFLELCWHGWCISEFLTNCCLLTIPQPVVFNIWKYEMEIQTDSTSAWCGRNSIFIFFRNVQAWIWLELLYPVWTMHMTYLQVRSRNKFCYRVHSRSGCFHIFQPTPTACQWVPV